MPDSTVTCTNCGSAMPNTYIVCSNCGAQLSRQSVRPTFDTNINRSEIRSDKSENLWAVVAHASFLFPIITAKVAFFIPYFISGGIYFYKRGTSRHIAFQALQALVFQIVADALTFFISVALMPALGIGFAILPFLIFATWFYAGYAAYECYKGKEFRYWLIGDFINDRMK